MCSRQFYWSPLTLPYQPPLGATSSQVLTKSNTCSTLLSLSSYIFFRCGYCSIPYSIIAKSETFEEDLRYTLEEWKFSISLIQVFISYSWCQVHWSACQCHLLPGASGKCLKKWNVIPNNQLLQTGVTFSLILRLTHTIISWTGMSSLLCTSSTKKTFSCLAILPKSF